MKSYTAYIRRVLRYTPRYRMSSKQLKIRAESAKEAYEFIKNRFPDWHISMFWLDWTQDQRV